jgi:hypothetical protein
MDYTAIPFEDPDGLMLSVDEARRRLALTEPLDDGTTFWTGTGDPDLSVAYEKGWFDGDPTDPAAVWLNVPGLGQYQLTFQAAQQLGSTCRINQRYQIAVPPSLLAAHVNWWLTEGLGERELKLLLAGSGANPDGVKIPLVVAQCRATIVPFSNLRLLEVVLDVIREKLGDAAADSALVDYKFFHDLEHTSFRVVVPAVQQVIEGTGTPGDAWCYGIEVSNSQIGNKQTTLGGYLFRFATTAGIPDVEHAVGGFQRRGSAPDDVFGWAFESTEYILDGLESAFRGLQTLTGHVVDGDYGTVLIQLFKERPVSKDLKLRILADVEERPDELTMFDLADAAAGAANLNGSSWREVRSLHDLAGHIVHQGGGMCDGSLPRGCRRLLPTDWDAPSAAAHDGADSDSLVPASDD